MNTARKAILELAARLAASGRWFERVRVLDKLARMDRRDGVRYYVAAIEWEGKCL